jgi:WXG100 family type VII secretion target
LSFSFNFEIADYTLDGMDRVNKNIAQALHSLEETCENSLADWSSDARDAYRVSKRTWDAFANQMSHHLQNARIALLSISEGYGTTEQRATKIWENTRSNV